MAGIKGQAPSGDAFRLPDEPAPYRGLGPFEPEHSPFFFGRETEIREVLKKLGQHAFVAVIGASGTGKSSLVLGGILPKAREAGELGPNLRAWIVRPGSRPLRALADRLATLVPPEHRLELADKLHARFAGSSEGLRTALSALRAEQPGPSLLVVDQLEELFTHASEEKSLPERTAFLAKLQDALENGRGAIRIIAKNRDSSFLYSGARLAQAEEILSGKSELLNERESEFLKASAHLRDERKREEEERTRREIEAARNLAQ